MKNTVPRRVAIACQGGGSHTAFTAGVLQGLIERPPDDVELVALSGTSGGAICAALAWDGLLHGDRKRAVDKLQGFWRAMAATEPWDQMANQALIAVMSLRDLMVLPEVSPYHFPTWAEDHFRKLLEEYLDFAELRARADRVGAPVLQIGAVEVLSGHFELFTGHELSVECLLASAAIPELFRAVEVPGRGVYWDGLFSQNPPIRELTAHQIDELWLIQINPSTCERVPMETHEIFDRRNALAGNLAMMQELDFIETINRKIADGTITDTKYRTIHVGRIPLERALGYRSKLNRDPEFLNELREFGRTKARWFLKEREATKYARASSKTDGASASPLEKAP
jgi:NTE family protein